jgi:MFS family permease
VFLLVGLPGLLVSLLLLTVREPVRQGARPAKAGSTIVAPASLGEVWAYVRENRGTVLYLNLGLSLVALYGYGATSWAPSVFIRRHGWTPGQTGLVFGLIVAVSGTLGIVTGGRLADRLRHRGQVDGNPRVALLATVAGLPFVVLFPMASEASWAATLLVPVLFFMSMPFGVAPAAIQEMMPNTMRAQASALYLFMINLIGLGVGPTLVAWLTEDIFRDRNAVDSSLLVVGALAYVPAAILLWLGLNPYRRSLDCLKAWTEENA